MFLPEIRGSDELDMCAHAFGEAVVGEVWRTPWSGSKLAPSCPGRDAALPDLKGNKKLGVNNEHQSCMKAVLITFCEL